MATPSNKYPADTEAMHNTIRRTTHAASNEAAHEPKRELRHGRVSERMRSGELDLDLALEHNASSASSDAHFTYASDALNVNDNKTPAKKKPSKPKTSGDTGESGGHFWSEVLSYIKILVLAAVIAFLCNTFIIVNAEVPTGSMRDTIMEQDRLIGFRLSYKFSAPQRGDIIIFKFPDDETETYVKRIIGLPGDMIEIMPDGDGVVHVYVNGQILDEPYIREPMAAVSDYQRYIVPEGHYFAMGDNRNSSLDSRYWDNKYIARDKILAKAVFKYYKEFKILK